jgi:predicted outer membrane lipoprotein
VQTLSPQNRILSVIGAVEAGVALWYFTSGHWVNGIFLAIAVAFLIAVYLHRERKVKGQGGRRRY